MKDFNEYNCRLFKCRTSGKNECCYGCVSAGSCKSKCGNSPDRCGHSEINADGIVVRCPCFNKISQRSKIDRKRIVCKGMIDGTNTVVCFASEAERDRHLNAYCKGQYKECPLAAATARVKGKK